MAGEGIHIPVDADDKDLRKLAASLRAVKKEASDAAKALRDTGHAAKVPHGNPSGGPHGGGGSHRGGFLHSLARLTRGTEFGHFAHMGANVAGVGAAGAGMMAFGVAAAGATLAMKAIAEFSGRAVEAAKREIEMRIELTHAIRDSVKNADSKAIGAFTSNKDALLSLAGIGGDSAVNAATKFGTEVGPGGIKAYAAIAGMHGGFQEGNLEAARMAAGTGQISVDRAAEMISSGKVRGGGDPAQMAADILSQAYGHRVAREDIGQMMATASGSKMGQAAESFEAGEGRITAAGIRTFTTDASGGSITVAQDKEAGEIANPTTAAVKEVRAKLDEQLLVMHSAAEAQWRIVKWTEHTMGFWGLGSGSLTDDYNRAAQTRP